MNPVAMRPHARQPIGIARLSLHVVLLVCLAIRPVLLVVAPVHELTHAALDAGRHHERVHEARAIAACDHAALHSPGVHSLAHRHGVIVAADVPVPAPIRAVAAASVVRFACACIPVPVARYTVPFRPPIA